MSQTHNSRVINKYPAHLSGYLSQELLSALHSPASWWDLIYKVFQIAGAGWDMVHNYISVCLRDDVSPNMQAKITLTLNIRTDAWTWLCLNLWFGLKIHISSNYIRDNASVHQNKSRIFQNTKCRVCVVVDVVVVVARLLMVLELTSLPPRRRGPAGDPQPLLPSGALWRQQRGFDQQHAGQGRVQDLPSPQPCVSGPGPASGALPGEQLRSGRSSGWTWPRMQISMGVLFNCWFSLNIQRNPLISYSILIMES